MSATQTELQKSKIIGRALIADDELSNRIILKALLKKLGYEVCLAENGAEAVELFEREPIDMVFMDIMMPVMDGYIATERIKASAGEKFIPVIFLTAMTDESALSRCIEVGGDDFLTKPFSHIVLAAKIKAMERIQELHHDVITLYSRMHRDEEIAEEVFNGAVIAGNVALDHIRQLVRPASIFSGDILLTAYAPSHDLHVLMGDFTGHGLAAALGALPASEVFRSMTAKGFSPQQILQGINNKLNALLPTGMFLAAQFVKISHTLDHITAFNCGMPDFFLLDGKTRAIKHRISSLSLPLGITSEIDFHDAAVHIRTQYNDHVLLATDGVSEARNPDGEYFGIERLEDAITHSYDDDYILNTVSRILEDFCLDAPQDDDISLAEIPLIPELLPAWDLNSLYNDNKKQTSGESPQEHVSNSVEFHITLRGSQLKQADPVPMLINYIQEMVGLHEHRRPLFTILTELFVNALDHGVLGLDSNIKKGPEGFTRYFEERERLLNELKDGFIRIGLRIHPFEQGGKMVIQIEDSGTGFNFSNEQSTDESSSLKLSGRGIQLVQGLCESIQYENPGNKAEAIYVWQE